MFKNILTALFIGLSVPARADDDRVQVFNRCMSARGDKDYCNCKIIETPRYTIQNPFLKQMAAQKCYERYGAIR